MLKANLSLEQVSKLKLKAVGERPYADRISLQFAWDYRRAGRRSSSAR